MITFSMFVEILGGLYNSGNIISCDLRTVHVWTELVIRFSNRSIEAISFPMFDLYV